MRVRKIKREREIKKIVLSRFKSMFRLLIADIFKLRPYLLIYLRFFFPSIFEGSQNYKTTLIPGKKETLIDFFKKQKFSTY